MNLRTARAPRIAVVTMLAALSACTAPPVYAISPPPIDDSRLPEPARPAPSQPTVQRATCTVPLQDPERGRSDTATQLTGLDMSRVRQLTRGSGQRVAIIDTGVAPHRRLPHLVAGGDYVFTGDGTQDCDGHGTMVAGIISAASDSNGADDFSGIAPEATLISIRQSSTKFGAVTDPSGSGFGDVNTMAMAVRTAADLGASVINISSVACVPAESVLDDRALGAALAYAVDVKDVVVVAAAGNTGGQCPPQPAETTWDTATVAVSPAWYDDYVLTVGSVNAEGMPSAFTLAGPWVDVAAPGEAVVSLSPVGDGMVNALAGPDGPAPISGTSYATPIVSGLAALIRSRFPTLTARQVMARIETTAHHPPGGWDPFVGSGVVDALAAVSSDAAAPATTAPAPNTPQEPTIPPPAPAPAPPDPRPRNTAVTGAAVCLAVLVAVLAASTSAARLRSGRHGITGD